MGSPPKKREAIQAARRFELEALFREQEEDIGSQRRVIDELKSEVAHRSLRTPSSNSWSKSRPQLSKNSAIAPE